MEKYSMFLGSKNKYCENDSTTKCNLGVNVTPIKLPITFLDWNNQYWENDYIIQSNLQIQRNPYQTTNDIFHRKRTKTKKFHNLYGNTKDTK